MFTATNTFYMRYLFKYMSIHLLINDNSQIECLHRANYKTKNLPPCKSVRPHMKSKLRLLDFSYTFKIVKLSVSATRLTHFYRNIQ